MKKEEKSLTVGTERCVNASHQRLREQQVEGDRAESGQARQGSYPVFFASSQSFKGPGPGPGHNRITHLALTAALPFSRDISTPRFDLLSPPRLVMCRRLAPDDPQKIRSVTPRNTASALLPRRQADFYQARMPASVLTRPSPSRTSKPLHAYTLTRYRLPGHALPASLHS